MNSGPIGLYFESMQVSMLMKLAVTLLLTSVQAYQATNDVISVVEASLS